MKAQLTRISLVLSCVVLITGIAHAQVSGIPGDGIPDVYYFQGDGLTAVTSFGEITRPAGTLTVDTDGTDMIAAFIGGPDVSVAGCDLCEGTVLPITPSAGDIAIFGVGFSPPAGPPGSTQWFRSSPLQGRGFVGVIGTGYVDGGGATVNSWPADQPPFVDYAEDGLANYGAGLVDADFLKVFTNPVEEDWSVLMASDGAGSIYTNVTVVPIPEPASLSLLGLAGLALLGRRRG